MRMPLSPVSAMRSSRSVRAARARPRPSEPGCRQDVGAPVEPRRWSAHGGGRHHGGPPPWWLRPPFRVAGHRAGRGRRRSARPCAARGPTHRRRAAVEPGPGRGRAAGLLPRGRCPPCSPSRCRAQLAGQRENLLQPFHPLSERWHLQPLRGELLGAPASTETGGDPLPAREDGELVNWRSRRAGWIHAVFTTTVCSSSRSDSAATLARVVSGSQAGRTPERRGRPSRV
jgi:hypothetical protein